MRDVFKDGLARIVNRQVETATANRNCIHSACESPIERQMADALIVCSMMEDVTQLQVFPLVLSLGEDAQYIAIVPQHTIGRYRVDFAVVISNHWIGGRHQVVVECDGHDFHEKTKEQAARDKLRDRELLCLGWPVMRFTGSEIHRDAAKCAEQVVDALMGFSAELPEAQL